MKKLVRNDIDEYQLWNLKIRNTLPNALSCLPFKILQPAGNLIFDTSVAGASYTSGAPELTLVLQGSCYSSLSFQCIVVSSFCRSSYCFPWSCQSSDLTISVCSFDIFKFLLQYLTYFPLLKLHFVYLFISGPLFPIFQFVILSCRY